MLKGHTKGLALLLLMFIGASPAWGGPPADEVRKTVAGTVDIRRKTQEHEDQWAVEKTELEARYRSSKAHIEALQEQTALWERKLDVLQGRADELHRRIRESERLDANLQETLEGIMDRLEAWVAQDLPFLPEERAQRLNLLRETLAQTDISGAEKLRIFLEALLVECGYGDTVEVYEQKIEVAGEPLFAHVFRLGRLAIFWETPDNARVGEYDRVTHHWVELPAKYARNIAAAMEMAEKRRPIELLRLPLGRITP